MRSYSERNIGQPARSRKLTVVLLLFSVGERICCKYLSNCRYLYSPYIDIPFDQESRYFHFWLGARGSGLAVKKYSYTTWCRPRTEKSPRPTKARCSLRVSSDDENRDRPTNPECGSLTGFCCSALSLDCRAGPLSFRKE